MSEGGFDELEKRIDARALERRRAPRPPREDVKPSGLLRRPEMRSKLQHRLLGESVGAESSAPQEADVTDEGGHRLLGGRTEIEALHHAASEQNRRVRTHRLRRARAPPARPIRDARAEASGAPRVVGELAVDRIESRPMQGTERIEVERRRLPTSDRFTELGKCPVEQPRDLKEAPGPRTPALEHGEERLPGSTVEPQRSRRQLAEPVDEALPRSVVLIEHERCLHADVDRLADRRDRDQIDDTDTAAPVAQRQPPSLGSRRLRACGGPSRPSADVPDVTAAQGGSPAW